MGIHFRSTETHAPRKAKLGHRITELRKKKSISQRDLADLAEVNRSQLNLYETGKKTPTFYVLLRIARALGATLSEFQNCDVG